jgi:diacylglycerol kinase
MYNFFSQTLFTPVSVFFQYPKLGIIGHYSIIFEQNQRFCEYLMTEDPTEKCTFIHPKRTWRRKFDDAFRGIIQSIRQQSSYRVHFFFAMIVPIIAVLLKLHLLEWCFVILLIAVVIVAEMFNSAIETLSRVITDKYDKRIMQVLDITSGAVLVVSTFAAILGTVIFIAAFLRMATGNGA